MSETQPFFIHFDWFNPARPDEMNEGDVYGGDRMFMVGFSDSLSGFLTRLLSVIDRENCTLMRIHAAGPPSDYEIDTAPLFDIDLPALVDEARTHGVLVAKPARSFNPHGQTASGKCLAFVDITADSEDEADDDPVAGQLHQVAIVGTPAKALEMLLSELRNEGSHLNGLDYLYDARDDEYAPDETGFDIQPAELLAAVRSGETAWSDGIGYESGYDA